MKKLDMVNPVIVNAFNPFLGASAYEDFNHKAAIYYCYDNIDAAVWASKHGSRLEQEFIQHVDAVVFSSEALQESKETGSKKSFVVHNGVDLTLFEKEMTCLAPPHSGQEKNICYIGSIDDRLDYDLLEKTILHFPRWNFHFIGRMMSNETERLKAFPNVKFYGAVDPKELPAMLKGCDAGIIPFVKNDFTKNIYPMKVNEYFAMGLPVVMTDFADIKDLADLVSVGNTESFITHLADEIDSDSAEKKSIRSHRVIQNSWKNKALEFENILLQYV
jgi:glycosyltransferase involved in cell wall biosynthesis